MPRHTRRTIQPDRTPAQTRGIPGSVRRPSAIALAAAALRTARTAAFEWVRSNPDTPGTREDGRCLREGYHRACNRRERRQKKRCGLRLPLARRGTNAARRAAFVAVDLVSHDC